MSDTETPIEIPEEVPEIDPIQVIHEGQCESLSGRSTLTFSVGRHPDTGALHLRIVGNTGGGMWCDEWIPGSEIDAVVIGDPELTSRSFQVLKPNRRYVFTGYATEMAQHAHRRDCNATRGYPHACLYACRHGGYGKGDDAGVGARNRRRYLAGQHLSPDASAYGGAHCGFGWSA